MGTDFIPAPGQKVRIVGTPWGDLQGQAVEGLAKGEVRIWAEKVTRGVKMLGIFIFPKGPPRYFVVLEDERKEDLQAVLDQLCPLGFRYRASLWGDALVYEGDECPFKIELLQE